MLLLLLHYCDQREVPLTGNPVEEGQEQVEGGQDQLYHHVGLQAGHGGAESLVEGHSEIAK